uniref:Uncharacterized protein n=1 Tax=Bionectria ochroleuca TaxID=29856 RepID=A0A0B7K6A7_BIOOC
MQSSEIQRSSEQRRPVDCLPRLHIHCRVPPVPGRTSMLRRLPTHFFNGPSSYRSKVQWSEECQW